MNGYRKELKFIVGDDVLIDVRNRISGLMKYDVHQCGDYYRIRSVYFDSPGYSCYRENIAGVSPREKYRIRTYDCSDDPIAAEIKIRHRDTISKMSAKIGRELFDALISDDRQKANELLSASGNRVLEKYLAKYMAAAYRPACIVDYERSAYVYDTCNVRITFDRNIFASREFERFFDTGLTGLPVLDSNMHVLEVKYDEFLPYEIESVLGGMRLVRSSCSKYALGIERLMEVYNDV
ncbi:MAG: polyphosphate polymerase domain-containing protein [Lachnospiraceae bacterium]|nr:polyphosphate polymerase domain-containing protein [Lachnospiraceae bacterium]